MLGRKCLVASIAGLLLAGCASDEAPPGPDVLRGGRIVGRVHGLDPESPLSVYIVSSSPGPQGARGNYYVRLDRRGAFGATLPEGDYLLSLRNSWCLAAYYSTQGLVLEQGRAETLRVREDIVPDSLVMRLGELRVMLGMPAEVEGTFVSVALRPEQDLYSSCEPLPAPRVEVTGGRVDVSFLGVPTGAYLVYVEFEDLLSEGGWAPGVLSDSVADRVLVHADHKTLYQADWPAPARVHGRLTGAIEETGWQGSLLLLDSSGRRHGVERDTADWQFATTFFSAGSVKLAVDAFTRRWLGGTDVSTATEYTLVPGEEIDVGDVPTTALEIEFDGLDPDDAPDLEVEIRSGAHRVHEPLRHGPTANLRVISEPPLGPFQLGIPRDGSYRTPWLPFWYPASADTNDAEWIEVPEGSVTRIRMVLTRGGEIQGWVTTAWGRPDAAARVYVTHADSTARLVESFLGWSGHERNELYLRGLPDGGYKLGAAKLPPREDQDPWFPDDIVWWPGTASWDSAGVITIEGHNVVSGIRIATR